MTMRNKRGFTLIELLVVVAIIALLISILLPSIESARAQARAVVCRTKLHDLHTAQNNYALQFADWIPCPQVHTRGPSLSHSPGSRQDWPLVPGLPGPGLHRDTALRGRVLHNALGRDVEDRRDAEEPARGGRPAQVRLGHLPHVHA